MVTTLQLVGECLCRGIKFLPVNIWKSDASAFLPEDGNIRMPFSSLPGLGEAAAQRILDLRKKGELYSVEDLQHKAGISKSVIELLRRNKALEGLNETNQYSLF
jgi:DNA polymerase-3 subunit alpha (Gram-positive type)